MFHAPAKPVNSSNSSLHHSKPDMSQKMDNKTGTPHNESGTSRLKEESSQDNKWRCSACTVLNDDMNINCSVCMTKRWPEEKIDLKNEQKQVKQVSIVNPSISIRLKALFSKTPPQWTCPKCTYINKGIYSQCQSCWFHRPADEPTTSSEKTEEKSVSVPSVFESFKILFRRTPNSDHVKSDPSSRDPPLDKDILKEDIDCGKEREEKKKKIEEEEMWPCQQCTLLNPLSAQKCLTCEFSRDFALPDIMTDSSKSSLSSPSHSGDLNVPIIKGDPITGVLPHPPPPPPPPHLPSPVDQRHHSLLSSQGAPTWRCSMCRAFNVVNSGLQRCFICGIGTIPECYLTAPTPPQLGARDNSHAFTTPQVPPSHVPCYGPSQSPRNYQPYYPPPHPPPLIQKQVDDCFTDSLQHNHPPPSSPHPLPLPPSPLIENPVNQDSSPSHFIPKHNHLSPPPPPLPLPLLPLRLNENSCLPQSHLSPRHNHPYPPPPPPQGPASNAPSPGYHHLNTHVNHLQASSSLSPQRITSSDGRADTKTELSSNSHYSSSSLSYSIGPHSLWDYNSLLHSGPVSPGSIHPVSPLQDNSVDMYYERPRTPIGYIKATPPSSTLEYPQQLNRREEEVRLQDHQLVEEKKEKEEEKEEEERRGKESRKRHGNRTKCVRETRDEDVVRASVIYRGIERYSRMSREPFTDPDFPPADKSLYIDPTHPVTKWGVAKWERPIAMRDDFDSDGIEWTVFRNPRPEDIAQGVLGNCWVLSALGVIAEQPQLIEDILITKQYCGDVGAYQVRLCRDGEWEVVVIDDCFPCLETGDLVFSKNGHPATTDIRGPKLSIIERCSNGHIVPLVPYREAYRKQLWVPLIEKALAKLFGSYEALNAGRVLLGLSTLTGLPCEKMHLKKKPSSKAEDIDKDLVWARLLSFRERGFPMSASCGGDGGEEEEKTYALLGLEANHSYSILDVRQIGTDQLVRLKNPWGKYSWKGSWSDQDQRWQSCPWMRDELRAVGGEAGVFWMGAEEFFQYFCEVDVCKYRPNWYSVRSRGKLLPFSSPQLETLAFEVQSTTEVDITLYQPNRRGNVKGHLVDMAVLVVQYKEVTLPSSSSSTSSSTLVPISCTIESGSLIQPIVTTNGFLSPGRYAILPLAFNHYQHTTTTKKKKKNGLNHRHPDVRPDSIGGGIGGGIGEGIEGGIGGEAEEGEKGSVPYVVAVFSAHELEYENVITSPGFLPESLMLLAEKTGRVTESFPNMLLYEVYLRHSCRYVVAVNLDHHLHFTVACNGQDSENVTCSRGDVVTLDCIPPRHRQVLWVLTQLEGTARYSVLMKITSSCSQLNSSQKWGAQHFPALSPTNSELHSPRAIIS